MLNHHQSFAYFVTFQTTIFRQCTNEGIILPKMSISYILFYDKYLLFNKRRQVKKYKDDACTRLNPLMNDDEIRWSQFLYRKSKPKLPWNLRFQWWYNESVNERNFVIKKEENWIRTLKMFDFVCSVDFYCWSSFTKRYNAI